MSKKPQVLTFKRGDTFTLGCSAFDEDGTTSDLSATTVTSQVRNSETGDLISTLDVVWVNRAAGTFELWAPGDGLADWPVGWHNIDIQYSALVGGKDIVRSTETFIVEILQDETR